MGTKSRPRPKFLAQKLKRIRESLGASQGEMINQLGSDEKIVRSTISAFERGVREPSYLILLRYARVAGISTDILIDDNLRLTLDDNNGN